MSGKGSLLFKTSAPLGTSLAWRTLFWAYVTTGHVSFCEECGMCSKPEIWKVMGSHLSLRCVPTVSLGLNLLYITKLLAVVLLSNNNAPVHFSSGSLVGLRVCIVKNFLKY